MSDVVFRGVVLAGGASRRMGRDKALIEIDGRPMAAIAADALTAAGARTVSVIGGDATALARHGLHTVTDRYPGEGPLGALLTAFAAGTPHSEDELVMVLTCDLPQVDASVVVPVLHALAAHPEAAAAAPRLGGRWQLLSAAYRPAAVRSPAQAAFDAGERAVRAGLHGLVVAEAVLPPALHWRLEDADTPDRLPGGLAAGIVTSAVAPGRTPERPDPGATIHP